MQASNLEKKYSSHQSNGLWNSKQKDVKRNRIELGQLMHLMGEACVLRPFYPLFPNFVHPSYST